jgi:hypothetical protein
MPAFSLSSLLGYYAIFFGWSSMIAVATATYAWTRFRACMKAPFDPSSSSSDVWEEMFTFWNMSGLGMAGCSILSCCLWLIL